uniref:Large ribosomal subunit protein eL33 n=1 Tax=Heterorhabditis bacteriophora TaxID=37862 RepID=A0A1I7XU26_HETBA
MRSVMIVVGIVYFLLVANFYNESHGFTKFYNEMYPVCINYRKITPIVFLIIFSLLHGGGLYIRDRFICALGLLFGGIGDYLIGISHEGIITGAVAFGIGHFIYMTFFIHHHTILCWPLLVAMLLWGALVGHVCVFPLLAEQPIAVGIMTVYSLILSTCFFISASQYINQPPTKRSQDPPSVLLSLPLIALCVLTLTTSMHPQPRFTTSASFAVLAISFYLSSSSWMSMAGAYSFICLANLLYYLSFSPLLQSWSIPLGVATVLFLSMFSYHCFADLVVSIPFLVLLLSLALASSSLLLVAAGSLCQYGQHGDYDAHQVKWLSSPSEELDLALLEGVFTGFKRGLRTQSENTALLKLEGVFNKEDAHFYVGKRAVYLYKAHNKTTKPGHTVATRTRAIWGRITRVHGNAGAVRAKFHHNLPPNAMGNRIRISSLETDSSKAVVLLQMLYPSNI